MILLFKKPFFMNFFLDPCFFPKMALSFAISAYLKHEPQIRNTQASVSDLKRRLQKDIRTMCFPNNVLCAQLFPFMFGLSSLFKCFPFTALVISAFLLGFLLIGGSSTDPAYSSVFLIKASFNQTSPMFPLSASNTTVGDLIIRANYMALCMSTDTVSVCSPSKNLTTLESTTTIINGPINFSLVTVAETMTKVCRPYLLVTSIVLMMLLLLLVIWTGLPFVPGKLMATKIALGLTGLTVIVWGLGAMLQQQGVEGAKEFINVASMGMVVVRKGARAHAMAWTSFAFVLAAFMCLSLGVLREHFLKQQLRK